MAKILYYCGREHHLAKMGSVVTALQRRGHIVIAITSANSINLDPNTEALIRHNVPYLYSDDYIGDVEGINRATKEVLGRIQPLAASIPPFWLAQGVREQMELHDAWRNLLTREKPDIVMALHGANFFANPLLYLAYRAGVPTVTFQEGRIRHLDQATMGKQALATEYSRLVLVWSEAVKQAYIEAGREENRIAVTGLSHLDWLLQNVNAPGFRDKVRAGYGLPPLQPVITFAPPQINRFEGDFFHTLSQLAQWANGHGALLVLKLHPFTNDEAASVIRRQAEQQNVKVFVREDTLPLLAVSDIIVTQHSTIADEALAVGVPLVEVDLDNAGVLESYGDVAVQVRGGELDKLGAVLSRTLKPSGDVEAWKAHNLGVLDGRATERAVRAIEGLL